jgi:GAF domain-containing protein
MADHQTMEARLRTLSEAFVDLTLDFHHNVQRLVEAAMDILGADGAVYGRLVDGWVYPAGGWSAVGGFTLAEARPGRICHDVAKRGGDYGVVIVRDLPATHYARTDPTIAASGWRTYVGLAVQCFDNVMGTLVVAYRDDVAFDESDRQMMGLLASAIWIEEERMLAGVALRSPDPVLHHPSADFRPPKKFP